MHHQQDTPVYVYPTSILRNGTTQARPPSQQQHYPNEVGDDDNDTNTKDTAATTTSSPILVYTCAAGVVLTILGALLGSLCGVHGLCGGGSSGAGAIVPHRSSNNTDNMHSDTTTKNLVFNGNFDGGLSGWKREWRVEAGRTEANVRVGNDVAFGGRLSQTIPVIPHRRYQLSASLLVGGDVNNEQQPKSIRGGAMLEGSVDPMYLDFDHDVVATTATITDDASFQNVSLSFRTGSSNHVTIFFEVGTSTDGAIRSTSDHFLVVDTVVLWGPQSLSTYIDPFTVFDWSRWDIAGEHPVVQPPMGHHHLRFDALTQCSPYEDGCAHVATTRTTRRHRLFESIQYTATVGNLIGVETIVTQWLLDDSSSPVATVYLSDVSQDAPNFFLFQDPVNGTRWLDFSEVGGDGVANNGILDLFVVFPQDSTTTTGVVASCSSRSIAQSYSGRCSEHVVHVGTLQSGDMFDLYGENDHGDFLFNITISGTTKTVAYASAARSTQSSSSLLFGSYDQARDTETLQRAVSCEEKEGLSALEHTELLLRWYSTHPQRESAIEFANVDYQKVTDDLDSADASVDLVFNGDFAHRLSGWRQAEWTSDGVPGADPDDVSRQGEPLYFAARVGDQGDPGRLSQTIKVVPKREYKLSAMISVVDGKRGEAGVALCGLESKFDADIPVDTYYLDYTDTTETFQHTSVAFNSGSSEYVSIFFDAGRSGSTSKPVGDLIIDNVTLVGPPPPDFIEPFSVFNWSVWEIDGEHPVQPDETLLYDATEKCTLFPDGDGCIHEARTAQTARLPIDDQFESISYSASIDFSVGVETIITRWPDVAELVVGDVSEDAPHFFTDQDPVNGTRWLSFSEQGGDGVANNRAFDVFAVFRDHGKANQPDESFCSSGALPEMSYGGLHAERVVHLGVLRAGESFEFYGENDHGELLLSFTVEGETKTATIEATRSSSTSSLQFGAYDQARDPETLERVLGCEEKVNLSVVEKRKLLMDWYAATSGGRRSAILYHAVNHVRVVDSQEPPVVSRNLVFNGNFDDRLSGWMQEGGRSQWPWLPAADEPRDEIDSEVNSDHEAGRVGDDVGRLSQTITVVPNEDYTLSATIAVKEGHVGKAGLAFGGAAASVDLENPAEILYFDYTNATNDFQNVALTFNAGGSQHVTIFFDAGESSGIAVGQLLFDNVVLEGPTPDNFTDPFSVFDWSGWEIEGELPIVSSTLLYWNAPHMCLMHKYGCMHAARTVTTSTQDPLVSSLETLNYTATIDMSNGAETIVTGWLGVTSLYVSDVSENAANFFTNNDASNGTRWLSFSDQGGDGVANNGIFDLFLVFRDDASNATTASNCTTRPEKSYTGDFTETVVHVGTIASGDSFDFYGQNDGGELLFEVTVRGEVETATWSSNSLSDVWFGSFDQAKDTETHEPVMSCEERNSLSVLDQSKLLRDWYADQPERRSAVEMVDVSHTRTVREA